MLLLICGCDTPEPEQRGEKVTYLTGVAAQGREAYVYVAIDKGWFAEAGFDVAVQPGNGTVQNLQVLQGGQADFAIVDITAALIEHGKGTFRDFTVISAVHQRNLAAIMALEGSGVTTPADLAGKRIAYLPGGVARTLFDAYAARSGVDDSRIEWVNMPIQQMGQGLAAGSIDAATQFVVAKPALEAIAKGRAVTVLPYSDVLPDLYGNGLAVSRAALRDPERLRRFNTAMLRGLAFAAEHPDEAAAIFVKYQQGQTAAVAAAELTAMAPYVAPAGALDPVRVAANVAALPPPGNTVDPADVISYDLRPR
ncbi:ABC transporter substrate-binding protein [Catenuloplanes japonicus]|uniref:ABC transporter substrate-binding protein n=1 Tax=Catenuloplanes japonicus TaxID=33876 RepID=UPI000690FC62|nr:ABC transporter substrate-binding protein [Catenuloplanes japonicus]